MNIRWFDHAVADLIAIRRYVAEDNPTAAREIADTIRRSVTVLINYLSAGRPRRVPHTRELVITGTPYLLPYRVRRGTIEILRVLHGTQEWPPP